MNSEPLPDRRVRRTRKALRLALQYLVADKPFEQITIREIAEEADISYPTFFRHYPDKESLLSDLADDEIAALLDLTLPMFEENSFASSLTLCEHVRTNQRLWAALLTGGAAGNIRATFIAQTERRADQWPARAGWLPAEVGTPILSGITIEVLAWWLGKAPQTPPEDVARLLDRFFALTQS